MNRLHLACFLLGVVAVPSSVVSAGERHEYGDDCTTTCNPEDIKNPLQCGPQGKCECASGLYYNEADNRCVSRPNGLCTSHSNDGLPIRTCTGFATCWPNEKYEPTLGRQNGTCICTPEAKEDAHTGLCKLRYGSSTKCSSLHDCDVNSLVTCRFGRCGCQDEKAQKYNESSSRCESLVGGDCGGMVVQTKAPFPAAVCIGPNMECVGGKCVCETGYGKTHGKRCVKLTPKTHVCQESAHSDSDSYGYGWGSYSAKGGNRKKNNAKVVTTTTESSDDMDIITTTTGEPSE